MANPSRVSTLQLTANPQARAQGNKARLWIWAVFLLALLGAVWMSRRAVEEASLQIAGMARDVEAALAQDASPAQLVDDLVTRVYGKDPEGPAVVSYENALRALAYKLDLERRLGPKPASRAPGAPGGEGAPGLPEAKEQPAAAAESPQQPAAADPPRESPAGDPQHAPAAHGEGSVTEDAVWRAVRMRYRATWTVVAVLVLVFPTLYSVRVKQAIRELETTRSLEDYWSAVWFHRSKYFLADEASLYLFRRLGLAVLLSGSALFLLAPGGLKSSVIGEYARSISVPGSPSYPIWFTELTQASPFVIGLAGYLLYSLTVFTRRAVTRDISSRLFLALWNRGIVVVVLSLVLTGLDDDSNFSRALVFVAGVFPQTGIAAIGKVAAAGADRLARLEPAGFSEIPEIDLLKETSLQELGIYDVHDLAAADLAWLEEASGIEPRVLLRAADRAMLFHHLDAESAPKLAKLPAMTASDLVLFALGQDAYMPRWTAQGGPPPYPIGKQLTDAQHAARLDQVNKALGVQDSSDLIETLQRHRNVAYILDNRVMYPDL